MPYGFYRVAAAVHVTTVANPEANAAAVVELIRAAHADGVGIVVFPELTLTGYTAGDLLMTSTLITAQNDALQGLLDATRTLGTVAVIGVAFFEADRLYNTAAILQNGQILGLVPKSYLPNKKEFYDKRPFTSGRDIVRSTVTLLGREIPFGVDLLFGDGEHLTFGVEICEDLWAVTPPSNRLAENGANLLLNLSASNELIGKHAYREELVRTQSARCTAAYVYSSSGVGESTTDTVFGGHAIIAEYGTTLAQNQRFAMQGSLIHADVDLERLRWLRLNEGSYGDGHRTPHRTVRIHALPDIGRIQRAIDPDPFVPSAHTDQAERSAEIIQIQAHGLITRMTHAHITKAVIGVSGGLDSTLALLSTVRAFDIMAWDRHNIIALTMPGFGTTEQTRTNAVRLCEVLGVTLRTVAIDRMALDTFAAMGHDPDTHNVVYENVQARLRTSLLMNTANQEGGLVIGTGDLSEIALGWSTYNGDHMSMYALNSGIPKTLIRYVIASFRNDTRIAAILEDVLATPISPELLPHRDGIITQETESIVGPYVLHDFFLYHFIKYGARPTKIRHLAILAFEGRYDADTITRWLRVFLRRFFTQQFKRSAIPDGPKVGTISLSPRADWRMPSDADVSAWIAELDREQNPR